MDAYVIHSKCFSEPVGKAREVAIDLSNDRDRGPIYYYTEVDVGFVVMGAG